MLALDQGSDIARYGLGLSDGLKGQDGLDLGQFYDSLGGPEAYLGIAVPQVCFCVRFIASSVQPG